MTMFQSSVAFCTAIARLTPRSPWRFAVPTASNCSTAVSNKLSVASIKSKEVSPEAKLNLSEKLSISENDSFKKKLEAAESINDMLNLAMLPNLSTSNALKLISNITNEINTGKSQMAKIEIDKRFIHLREIVRADNEAKTATKRSNEDLSQYTQLSTPAMIHVIASLRDQRERNTPLLRMLSYNIVKYNMKLNLKQCATLLYSMAVLNFPDKVLLEKIMADLLQCISKSNNTVTNRSIITSLGFLQYKNIDVLDMFCETLFMKSMKYTPLDYMSFLQTFAILQYKSEKMDSFLEIFADRTNQFQVSSLEWLDVVWSLTILGIVQPWHIESVLEPAFTKMLNGSSKPSIAKNLKLLNINAFAQYVLKNYKGPLLTNDSEMFNNVLLVRTKVKQRYIDALSETLKNIFSSPSYFKMDIDTKMGFLLDAEFHINDECQPVLVENWDKPSKKVKRIGVMVHDYFDHCRGQNDLIGLVYLKTQLLKAKGYNIIAVSYENFSMEDKIEKRINYLKKCMKNVVGKKS